MELSAEQSALKIKELESRLEEYEQLIEAIKAGEVDAFALNKNNQSEIFTLQSGDYAYRMLVENFGEGALNLSEETLIVYTNNYFLDLLKLPYEAVIGKSFVQFIHPESKETFNELFEKGLAGQSKGEINLLAGKHTIPVYVSLTSLYPTLPTVGIIITDLTGKKEQEEMLEQKNNELLNANAELNRNKNFIHNVLQSTSHGVLSYVAVRKGDEVVDFIVRYANHIALEHLDFPPEMVIGNTYLTLIPHAKEYGFWQRLIRVLSTGKSEIHEMTSLRFSNRIFLANYTRLDDGVTCTFVEITEQKKQEVLLKEKNSELEKMNKELQSFAYISSHDLQEPLRKIQTFATRILEKEENNLSEYGKDNFKRMQDAAKRMQTLIQDLLNYSRTTTSERKPEITDLNKIVEEVKAELKEELQQRQATIAVNDTCEINIIPFQFRQLLHNLVSNSLKFSRPEHPPHIEITCKIAYGAEFKNLHLSEKIKYCHIGFSDNGIGFEQTYSDKIFELFQQLHGKYEYNGTGIGLSIVKKIVENHQGIITATGEVNKGATFDIYLPVIYNSF